jgi:hypothetical protein
MFVGDEVMLGIALPAARSGLARLALGGLLSPAQEAYRRGYAGLELDGGPFPLALARVQSRPLAQLGGSTGLAIRWEATGPGGGSFSILDADLGLVAAGDLATWLTLAGSYRIPPGQAPDRAILHHVAGATVRCFLSRLAAGLADQSGLAKA